MKQRIAHEEITPAFFDGLFKTGAYLKKSGLDPKLVELVTYRVSQINGCAFCLDMHHKDAIHAGETEQRLYSLAAWEETPYYTDKERAGLAFAEAVIKGHVADSIFDALTPLFSKQEIADLTLAIVTVNSWNKLNITFKIVPGTYKVGQFA
ncbi:alkylhydroperoxidase AhpD family core domain-containing protein [Chitinophaga sp. CF118]|uniref:carboxymuconolactone decarboxylase family protein n=1 Tax=Chitinophaga sp. CF118 TaxID=1884367 RepID=UPI0008E49423|nr:carboxymuconolactone decarboxylase family protein [Chitinophaga sp. CF118]SFE02263.1 alkylhydroperoxidase AhpD family core domain-containing protein [Chitinophaga sp. CF118]